MKSYWVMVAGFIIVLVFVANVVARRSGMLPGMEGFADGSCKFMMFGVPWCPHCVSAKPEFEKLGSSGPTVTIGARPVSLVYVNPEQDAQAASGYDIQGYPTFYLVKDGQQTKYSGPRTTDGFLEFLKQNVA